MFQERRVMKRELKLISMSENEEVKWGFPPLGGASRAPVRRCRTWRAGEPAVSGGSPHPLRRKVRAASFSPVAKTARTPLLLGSKRNPLRWAFVWETRENF